MFYFLSRRVSMSAIFVWSAVSLLCTMPGPTAAIPIEARLAEIIGANHLLQRSGCNVHSCKFIDPNNQQADPSPSVTSPVLADAPVATAGTPTPSGGPTEKSDPPPFVTPSEEPSEESPEPKPDSQPEPVSNVSQTSGALGHNLNFSPVMMWLMACSAGAALAVL